MFKHKDLNNYLIPFLDIESMQNIFRVNREWYGLIKASIYYPYLGKQKQEIFNLACENGKLEVAKWVCSLPTSQRDVGSSGSLGGVDHHADKECAFRWACDKGRLEVAKWLWSLGDVDHHADEECAFRWACENGHLEVAKWLWSLGDVDHHIDEECAFRWTCQNGHLEVAKWLYSLEGVNLQVIPNSVYSHEVQEWINTLSG